LHALEHFSVHGCFFPSLFTREAIFPSLVAGFGLPDGGTRLAIFAGLVFFALDGFALDGFAPRDPLALGGRGAMSSKVWGRREGGEGELRIEN